MTEFKVGDYIMYKNDIKQITKVTEQGIQCNKLWLGYKSIGFTYEVKVLVPTNVTVPDDVGGWK